MLKNGLVLDMVKVKIRSLVQWLHSVLYAYSLESTSLKIGESMKIGGSIDIATWKLPILCFSKNLFMQGFMIDGNFQAEHMRMTNPGDNVPLSDGTGFMVSKELYKLDLKLVAQRQQVSSISCISAGIYLHSDRDQHVMITVQ